MKREETGFVPFLKRYFSLIAWGICLCLVVMTFFQLHLPGEWWMFALSLVLLLDFYFVIKNGEAYPLPDRLRGWVIAVTVICGGFAGINFFLSMMVMEGSPDILDGAYITRGKGFVRGIVEYITEQEYHRLKCVEQRLIAGHMLFFYALLMYGSLRKKKHTANPVAEEKGD